jgi:hypothetical protein
VAPGRAGSVRGRTARPSQRNQQRVSRRAHKAEPDIVMAWKSATPAGRP